MMFEIKVIITFVIGLINIYFGYFNLKYNIDNKYMYVGLFNVGMFLYLTWFSCSLIYSTYLI